MKRLTRASLAVLTLGCGTFARAADWNAQDYDLYAGDFNGDGQTDILYIAKDPSKPSGIALSDGTGPNVAWQSWPSSYLGISWSGNQYNVIVADFNGDGKADIFLQAKTPGDSQLLLTDGTGKVVAISQVVSNSAMGLTWSGDQHQIIAGDFNGDGKADLFLQATNPAGVDAVVLADSAGQFSSVTPAQTWSDGYLGLKWSTQDAIIYSGDFNGVGRSDLLIQAMPQYVSTAGQAATATYPPNMNGVALTQADVAPFSITGIQAWSRNGYGVDWSPLSSTLVIADFNGDGRSDVLLQPVDPTGTAYLLSGQAKGAIFGKSGIALSSDVGASSSSYRLLAADFAGSGKAQLYLQARTPTGTNYLGSLSGSVLSATAQVSTLGNAATQPSNAQAVMSLSATSSSPATVAATSTGRTAVQPPSTPTSGATGNTTIPTPPGATANGFLSVDLNGDGIADALYIRASGGRVHWYARMGGASGYGAEIDTGILTDYASQIISSVPSAGERPELLVEENNSWSLVVYDGSGFVRFDTGIPLKYMFGVDLSRLCGRRVVC